MKPASTGTFQRWDTGTSASITAPTFTLKGQHQPTRSNRFGASRRTEYAARIATSGATTSKIISMLTLSAGTGDGTALRCSTRFLCGFRLRSRRQRCDSGPKNRLEISLNEWAFVHREAFNCTTFCNGAGAYFFRHQRISRRPRCPAVPRAKISLRRCRVEVRTAIGSLESV